MYDAASPFETSVHQRAIGTLRVGVRAREGNTVLDTLRQEGCLKARFPRPHAPGWLDVIAMNTSGGIAAGDRLASTLDVAAGASASFSSQAAERYYRAVHASPPARVRTALRVAEGAQAEWLAQETILFDGCALDRTLEIDLAPDARMTGLETLVFGRDAMGEHVHHAAITDRILIRRAGRFLLHDITRLHGAVKATLARPAVARGARVLTTLFHAAPDAETQLEPVRDTLALATHAPCEAGASTWNGLLLVRILSPDSHRARIVALAVLQLLRAGRPLPRVWHC